MFSFGFGDHHAEDNVADINSASKGGDPQSRRAARDHRALAHPTAEVEAWQVESITVGAGSLQLKRVLLPEDSVKDLLDGEGGDASAVVTDTDLVPEVYEGGFKLWECARDLLEVLHDMARSGELVLEGAEVLEAGCGAGLPGALAVKLGARLAVMQDYNPSVLTAVTMPTFQLNSLWSNVESGKVRFVSGDWACVSAHLNATAQASLRPENDAASSHAQVCSMDLILSSDTIYSSEATSRLWQLIRELLSADGTALIAAKSYYFGVGGSVAEFKDLVASDGQFQCRTVRVWEDGASNRRECLAVTRRSKIEKQ